MEYCRLPSHVELIWCLGLPNSSPIQIATAELQFLNRPWRLGIYNGFMGRMFIFAAVWKWRSILFRFICPTPMRQVRSTMWWAFCVCSCSLLDLWGSLSIVLAFPLPLSFPSSSSMPLWSLDFFFPLLMGHLSVLSFAATVWGVW